MWPPQSVKSVSTPQARSARAISWPPWGAPSETRGASPLRGAKSGIARLLPAPAKLRGARLATVP